MIATCLVQIKHGGFPIIGWRSGRDGGINALLVATARADGTLRYAGTVEWGLPAPLRATLSDALLFLSRPDCPLAPLPPVRGVGWVDPHLTLQVQFASWTPDGLLRHPLAEGVQLRSPAYVVMRVLLIADDGTPILAVDHAERYPLLELAAHLRLAITAAAEGWELPASSPLDGDQEPRIIAAVERPD